MKYSTPEIEMLELESIDVIQTSSTKPEEGTEPGGGDNETEPF